MSLLTEHKPNTPQHGEGASNAPHPRGALCPYCGCVSSDLNACEHCKGRFEPLSRQATQNAMGPWQIKDPKHPFLPGCSYERLRKAVEQGRVVRLNAALRRSEEEIERLAQRAERERIAAARQLARSVRARVARRAISRR